jgi:hypothetical protein
VTVGHAMAILLPEQAADVTYGHLGASPVGARAVQAYRGG